MPKNLLLADDSITIQKVVGITFAGEDFQVTAVDNGEDALARARQLRPDVILADVVMPKKNGYEVCEALKSDPATRDIPVLLLAGTFEAFDEARARAARADGHIAKPFESQALLTKVKELLSGGAQAPAPAAAAAPARAPVAAPPPGRPPAGIPPVASPFGAGAPPSAMPPPGARPPAGMPPPGRPPMPAGMTGGGAPPQMSAPPPGARPPMPQRPPAAAPPAPAAAPAAPARTAQRYDPFGLDEAPSKSAAAAPAPEALDLDWSDVNVDEEEEEAATPAPVHAAAAPIPNAPVATLEELDFGAPGADASPPPVEPDAEPEVIDLPMLEADEQMELAPANEFVPNPEDTGHRMEASGPELETSPRGQALADGGEAQLREALSRASREVIEKIAWEVVPQLAETIIREHVERLAKSRQG